LVFSLIFSFLPLVIQASSASLYLSPASGGFFVGSTFDVSVFVNTGGEDVNAVEVDLEFDPARLQMASPTAGRSFIEVWISQPTYSNVKGKMSFTGGIPSPGINTSSGLVSTITFRAIAPGKTTINFLDSSKVLLNDSEGTDVLTSKGRGVYDLLIPPPEGPRIFSSTHPDRNRWYKNNNPTFSWEKEEGVEDFSYSFDQDSTGVPDSRTEGEGTSVSFEGTESGIWYFHVKAKKLGVWGGVSHYPVRIDKTPPASFLPTIEPSPKTSQSQPLISFFSTDAFSGIDYYQVKYIDITPGRTEEETGFFVESISPYKLPVLETGKYLIIVRAYDKASNYKEGTLPVEIFPPGLVFTKQGIQYRSFMVSWWVLILLLLIILVIIVFLIWRKQRKSLDEKKEKLREKTNEIRDKGYWTE